MTPALEEAHRLLRLAVRDSDTFALLLPLPKATMAALGFHAQQAVEKALKAVCTRHNIEVRRTHDLTALGQAVLDHGTALPVSLDELRSLNPFAVEFRYDDEITSSMRREDLDALLRVMLSWADTEVDG